MKYIDFESWTVAWPHEGNVIVEDQLTHNFKRRSRTAPPIGGAAIDFDWHFDWLIDNWLTRRFVTTQGRILRRSAKCEQKLEMILF